VAQGSADSGAVKDLGKPDAGESHVRIDEGRLETGPVSGPQRLQLLHGQRRTQEPPRQSPTLPRALLLRVATEVFQRLLRPARVRMRLAPWPSG